MSPDFSSSFTNLTILLNATGLMPLFFNATNFINTTLLLPTDAAFNQLESDLSVSLSDLLSPEGLAFMTPVLLYHVITTMGVLNSTQIRPPPYATFFTSADNSSFMSAASNGDGVYFKDMAGRVSSVMIADVFLAKKTAVVHGIDNVLLPNFWQGIPSFFTAFGASVIGSYQNVSAAIGNSPVVGGGILFNNSVGATFFAPVDQAFSAAVAAGMLSSGAVSDPDNAQLVDQLLAAHTLLGPPGSPGQFAQAWRNGTVLHMLYPGASLMVVTSTSGSTMLVGLGSLAGVNATLVNTDISGSTTSGSVIHVLDTVLIPTAAAA